MKNKFTDLSHYSDDQLRKIAEEKEKLEEEIDPGHAEHGGTDDPTDLSHYSDDQLKKMAEILEEKLR